jgi:CHASE3 domain sensor protein
MNKTIISSLIAGLVLSSNLSAQCQPANAPTLVDGSLAPLEEIVANQQQVKAYMSEANLYLQCLDTEEENAVATGAETEETKVVRDAFYNATVDTMNLTAANFNQEIQKFKAQDSK